MRGHNGNGIEGARDELVLHSQTAILFRLLPSKTLLGGRNLSKMVSDYARLEMNGCDDR